MTSGARSLSCTGRYSRPEIVNTVRAVRRSIRSAGCRSAVTPAPQCPALHTTACVLVQPVPQRRSSSTWGRARLGGRPRHGAPGTGRRRPTSAPTPAGRCPRCVHTPGPGGRTNPAPERIRGGTNTTNSRAAKLVHNSARGQVKRPAAASTASSSPRSVTAQWTANRRSPAQPWSCAVVWPGDCARPVRRPGTARMSRRSMAATSGKPTGPSAFIDEPLMPRPPVLTAV